MQRAPTPRVEVPGDPRHHQQVRNILAQTAVWAAAAVAFQLVWPALAVALSLPVGVGFTVAIFGPAIFWAILLANTSLAADGLLRGLALASLLYWTMFIGLVIGAMWIASLGAP